MGKHVFTKVECFKCKKKFKTERLKAEGDEYECTHCGAKHVADYDEIDECWFHKLAEDV